MGIPSYYADLIKKYPSIENGPNKQVDYMFFDYNGMIHPVVHNTLCKGNSEIEFMNALWNKTKTVINSSTVASFYMIFVDGVAPLAKVSQQRKRRYLSEKKLWDTNAITSGTPFMFRLMEFLRSKSKDIYLNDCTVNGEGEHKIMDYIHNNVDENDTVIINGLDADLIILSLLSKCKNIYLMRDNNDNIVYVSIKNLKEAIIQEWKNVFSYGTDIVKSYCICMSFMGNDFIPHPIGIHIRSNGINILKAACQNTSVVKELEDTIDNESIRTIFERLAIKEEENVMKSLSTTYDRNWRKNYYNQIVFIDNIQLACKMYLDGIWWTFNYYNKYINTIDHSWYYPFNGSPTMRDIANYCVTYNYNPMEQLSNFITQDEQLLIVIPKKSVDVLPKHLKTFFTDKCKGLTHLYPDSFKLVSFLKKHEWEYTPILPLIDIAYIRLMLNNK